MNAKDDVSLEMPPKLKTLLESYARDPRSELSRGIQAAFAIQLARSHNECVALNTGLILGVLVAHISQSGWQGKKFIQDLVDATFNEKLRRQNLLKQQSQNETVATQPPVDVLKGVNDWLEKLKGGSSGTGQQSS